MRTTQPMMSFKTKNSLPVEMIPHIPPIVAKTPNSPQARLQYIDAVKTAAVLFLQSAVDTAPWKIDPAVLHEQQLYIGDVVDNLFFKAAEADWEAIEAEEEEERREQREHERLESAFVRRF